MQFQLDTKAQIFPTAYILHFLDIWMRWSVPLWAGAGVCFVSEQEWSHPFELKMSAQRDSIPALYSRPHSFRWAAINAEAAAHQVVPYRRETGHTEPIVCLHTHTHTNHSEFNDSSANRNTAARARAERCPILTSALQWGTVRRSEVTIPAVGGHTEHGTAKKIPGYCGNNNKYFQWTCNLKLQGHKGVEGSSYRAFHETLQDVIKFVCLLLQHGSINISQLPVSCYFN